MSKVREIAWPEEYKDLKRIEDFMVCGICYEYMETSVMTPCSHNYCSLCIRKYLHYKTQCPACFHVFFEKDLYINRAMDGLIQHYLQVREKLISLIENRIIYNTVIDQEEKTEKPPSTPPIRPVRNQFAKSPKILETKPSEIKTPVVNSPLASTSKFTSSPRASGSPKVLPSIAKMFNTPKRKEIVIQPSTNTKTVSCPVCSVDISETNINVHLDACLRRETNQEVVKQSAKSKRPPLPKLVLRVMKDAELRKKMKELGLSTQGDRRTLENRFTRYSTIYNAECDKLDPRPVADLIRQCEMDEKQERKMESFFVSASTSNRLQIERNAKEEKIEEAQKSYREANKSSFDKLIEEVRNRRKMEKAKQNDETTSYTSEPTTSASTESPTENISENDACSSFNRVTEVAFQDSDSDESCPLQHYKNDEHVKYISVNLNDSCSSPAKRPQEINDSKHIKEQTISEEASTNPYELPTDESTDEDIPISPTLNKNPNRKRVKLSSKLFNKSSTFSSSSSLVNNQSPETKKREADARDLCNSIINDFSFEGISDDSSSEFVDKPPKRDITVDSIKINGSPKNFNGLNRSRLELKMNSFCDKSMHEEKENCTGFVNNLDSGVHDISFNTLNTTSKDPVNVSIMTSKKNQELKANSPIKESNRFNNGTEKENDASSVNDNLQSATVDSPARRPVRKRNRPSRYTENQVTNSEDKEKASNYSESQESDSADTYKGAGSSDGSLKRRRGRAKANTDHRSDVIQNPPKRPVRRRQAVSDGN